MAFSGPLARRRQVWKYLWLLLGWGLLLLATTQLQYASLGTSHSVCGPWGCAPPTEALVACHAFWLALLLPPSYWAARRLPAHRTKQLIWGFLGLGLLSLAGIVFWQLAFWLPEVSEFHREYLGERIGFAIATTIDLPAIELLVCSGLIGWQHTRRATNR